MKTYEIETILQIKVKTEIADDGSSTPETLKHLIEEDLKDLGYEIDSITVVEIVDLSKPYWVNSIGVRYEFNQLSKQYIDNIIKMLKRSYSKEDLSNSKLFQGLAQERMLR